MVYIVMTRLRELTTKRRTESKSDDTELPRTSRYKETSEDQTDVGVVYEEQSYEAPVEDYGGQPAENYTAPIAESSNEAYVEEEYQELGDADINYVVSTDSDV